MRIKKANSSAILNTGLLSHMPSQLHHTTYLITLQFVSILYLTLDVKYLYKRWWCYGYACSSPAVIAGTRMDGVQAFKGVRFGTVHHRQHLQKKYAPLETICKGFGITMSQFFADADMVELTPDMKELFDCWVCLTPGQKSAAIQMLKAMSHDNNWVESEIRLKQNRLHSDRFRIAVEPVFVK